MCFRNRLIEIGLAAMLAVARTVALATQWGRIDDLSAVRWVRRRHGKRS
ncbi:MAG: hypothetical protein OES46_04235 [Gammaproteobacteria bacterium]|nr:hypothetical protein [Gammaproteobacteria bacterium]